MAEIPSDERYVIIFERVFIAVWKLGLIGLLLVFTYIPCSFIYLFIYLLVSRLFSLLFLTFILPIYHLLSPLSQSILHYLACIHFVISLCSNLLLLMLPYH